MRNQLQSPIRCPNNAPKPLDSAPNEELNFPVLSSAQFLAGNTTVSGTLSINGAPNLATVEVFRARFDPSGYGEGELYVGSATPDAFGNWTLVTNALLPEDFVTATATDSANNTSEFCQNAMVF